MIEGAGLTCADCKTLAPVWEKLTDAFLGESGVLIAKVDAEAPDSSKTAAAQDIKGYPTIKWFKAGSTEPETYSGGRNIEALVDFVNSKAGTFRGPDGRLTAQAGLVAALDALLEKGEAVAEAAKAETHERAAYYARVAEKLAKNPSYVEKELARVQGILSKGAALAAEKLDDLTVRRNILQKFKAGKKADDKSDKSEL
jgi:protein disulfide-isomerase A6